MPFQSHLTSINLHPTWITNIRNSGKSSSDLLSCQSRRPTCCLPDLTALETAGLGKLGTSILPTSDLSDLFGLGCFVAQMFLLVGEPCDWRGANKQVALNCSLTPKPLSFLQSCQSTHNAFGITKPRKMADQ